MTVAAALLLYVAVVVTVGPRLLPRLCADGRAPRWGIAAWLTACVSVLGCAVATAAILLVETAGHWNDPDDVLMSCLERLQAMMLGHAGVVPQLVATTAVALALAGLIAVCGRIARTLGRMRASTFAHADAVRMVGRPTGDDVVILDASAAAAYCVAGRPSAIVVTTGALAALEADQLAAVVAHERAHLAGHHAHLVAAVRGLAAALPRVGLFTAAATHVCALLEMCADDAAARRHGPQPLLAGLLALTGAPAPSPGLAAASVAVLVRARRLSEPHRGPARARARLRLAATLAVLAATPVGIGALAVGGALACFA
jgi:Zn-dependent protease with chaperone function